VTPGTAGVTTGGVQFAAKQYNRPAPPVETRFGWLQPRLGCVEFHELLVPPVLSACPSWAEGPGAGCVPGAGGVTFALLVQLPQV